jgi:methyl acetate hydrolase
MFPKLDSSLKGAVDSGSVPAIGAVILDRSGKTIYDNGYGTLNANDPKSKPFDSDSQLLLWSLTKLVTSLCVLQLFEQGKIDSLDDPVTKYVPRTAEVLQVLERFDETGKPVLRKPKKDVSLLHLFTHTSGMTYDFWVGDEQLHDYRKRQGRQRGTYVTENAEWQFYDAFTIRDPGEKWHYALGIDHLGFVVEEVSGLRLEDYVQQFICKPLGLKKTGPFRTEENLVVHLKDGEGKLTAVDALGPPDKCFRRGGGHYLVGSLREFADILVALVNQGKSPSTGKQILQPETVEKYVFEDFIPHLGASSEGIGRCGVSLVPGLSHAGDVGYSFRNSSAPRGWSCGLMINHEAVPGGRSAGSGCWAGLGNI